jgi:hypothetical protein
MVRTQDGFELAELDLNLRGPGEFFGTRQAGLPDFRVANLVRDRQLLELAKMEAARWGEGTWMALSSATASPCRRKPTPLLPTSSAGSAIPRASGFRPKCVWLARERLKPLSPSAPRSALISRAMAALVRPRRTRLSPIAPHPTALTQSSASAPRALSRADTSGSPDRCSQSPRRIPADGSACTGTAL